MCQVKKVHLKNPSVLNLGNCWWGYLGLKLKLYAVKTGKPRVENEIHLVVVDLDRSKHYPLNFVCVLPRYLRLLEKRSSSFAKIFGEKSVVTAKKLLSDAKRKEDDPEIKRVIDKRIKEMASKHEFKSAQKPTGFYN